MQISPINSNYQNNNTNFKGTVDKSVVRYLNEFQRDAVSKTHGWTSGEKEKLASKYPAILNSLKEFMAKLHPDTKLAVEEVTVSTSFKETIRVSNPDIYDKFRTINYTGKGINRYLVLHNTKLNSSTQVYNIPPMTRDIFGRYNCKEWHTYYEIERVADFVERFVKRDPKELDKKVFDDYILSIEKAAKQENFSLDSIKKAQDCSKEFGVENVNLEKVYSNLKEYNAAKEADKRFELAMEQAEKSWLK